MIPKDEDIEEGKIVRYFIIAVILIVLAIVNYYALSKHVSSNSVRINDFTPPEDDMAKYRNPAVAGIFYSSNKFQLNSDLEHYMSKDFASTNLTPRILIVPHAGYQYSAATAAKAYNQLAKYAGKIKKVILVGPSHYVPFKGAALSSADYFTTPLGKVKINKDMVDEFNTKSGFRTFDAPHNEEHSLEVQLPFLQKVLKNFTLLPIAYGDMEPEDLAKALTPYVNQPDTIIVISADLSHYYNYEGAQELDSHTADLIAKKKADVDNHLSCGATGINAAILLGQKAHLYPEMVDMSNSGDVEGGDKNRVVGYGSWVFGNKNKAEEEEVLTPIEEEVRNLKNFVDMYGDDLLKIAHTSIEDAVLKKEHFSPKPSGYEDALFDKGASFVTLKKNGGLRGCIGSILPTQAIAKDVADNAYRAAMEDSRFSQVNKDELKDLEISISLLTDFERVLFENESDLLSKLQPKLDGVIIRDGDRQGLFLPSVWEEIPDKQSFLNNLKLKAGMSPSYWSNSIKVYRFRTVEVVKDEY